MIHRLLIVDDEHHVVDWLVDLFDEQDDLELEIYKAYSGLEALKILEGLKIDIILMDIKMPGISGLEAADKIIVAWPDCRIIFLTGYSNFDYIYRANKLKNVTYLLKTEDDEGIIAAVTVAIQLIEKELKNTELINQESFKEKMLQHLLQRELLKDIVMGKHLKEIKESIKLYEQEFYLDITKPVYLIYAKLKSNYPSRYFVDNSNYLVKLMQLTEKILHQKFKYEIIDVDKTTILWFFQPTTETLEQSLQSPLLYLKEIFDHFIIACEQNLPCNVVLLLYPKIVTWNLVSNIYELLNQYSLNSTHIQASTHTFGMIFSAKEEQDFLVQLKENALPLDMSKLLKELTSYLYQGESEDFFTVLNQIKGSCQQIQSMHHLPMIELYQKIALIFTSYINQYDLSEQIATQIGIYPLYYFNNFKVWNESFIYLENLSHIIFQLHSSEQIAKNQKLILNIKQYIKNHLANDCTLTNISEKVNYNSSYISRFFKQGTGMSLSNYIVHARIDKSKELLLNSNLTVQSIACQVGFDTSQYFSLVFKKTVGMTPREYRNE